MSTEVPALTIRIEGPVDCVPGSFGRGIWVDTVLLDFLGQDPAAAMDTIAHALEAQAAEWRRLHPSVDATAVNDIEAWPNADETVVAERWER